MRLLHCSDFHIGLNRNKVDRRKDHDHVFAQIRELAIQEQVDVILNTGDFFDVASASPDVLNYGWDVLENMAAIAPVVVLCGNHDSKKLFELIRKVRGDVSRHENRISLVDPAFLQERMEHSVLTLPSRDGERIRIGSVPFIRNSAFLESMFAEGSLERATVGYADRVGMIEQRVNSWLNAGYDPDRDIRIFAAHLMVNGAVVSGSERTMDVEDSYATHIESIPRVDYAAFGHVHKPQKIGDIGRYAGSPIPIDFGEKDDQKSVYVVSGKPGYALDVRQHILDIGRPMLRIKGTLEQLRDEREMYAGTIAKVTVPLLAPIVDLDGQVRAILQDTIICDVQPLYPAPDDAISLNGETEDAEPSLERLFEGYLAKKDAFGDRERVGRYFGSLFRHVGSGRAEPPDLTEIDEAFG